MKTQTIIIVFLLALLITGSTIGKTLIPTGAFVPIILAIILVLLICLVYYVPNRIETIVDEETNNIVLNHYINDVLVKSTMKNKNGHVLYELEYKNGQIIRSRNYDEKGNLNIEQTYYDNGQVHFRNEIIKGKKKSTEFDRNGNKKQ